MYGDSVTFAQFSETGTGGNDFTFVNAGSSGTLRSQDPKTGAASIPVSFSLLSLEDQVLPLDLRGPQAAHMTLSIVTTQSAAVSGNFFDQNLYSANASGVPRYGSIVFTRNTPDAEIHKTNLLTISFFAIAGGLDGIKRGQTATLTADNGNNDSTQFDYVRFSSSYFKFDTQADENLALSFTSASPCFTLSAIVLPARGGCTAVGASTLALLHSFTAAGTGTFASDPPPDSVFLTPEPGSSDLTISGLVMILFWYAGKKHTQGKAHRSA